MGEIVRPKALKAFLSLSLADSMILLGSNGDIQDPLHVSIGSEELFRDWV